MACSVSIQSAHGIVPRAKRDRRCYARQEWRAGEQRSWSRCGPTLAEGAQSRQVSINLDLGGPVSAELPHTTRRRRAYLPSSRLKAGSRRAQVPGRHLRKAP